MPLLRYGLLAALALGGLLTGSEVHADRGTKREAINLVQQALNHIQTAGLEQALADFKKTDDNPFRQHDLYVFVYDYDGNNLGNSAPLDLPGTNLKDLRTTDGKLVIQQMIEMTKSSGGGAFEYDWINPETQQIESKISYFKKIPGFDGFIGAGYYKPVKPETTAELCTKQDAMAMVQKALQHIETVGFAQALEDFKQPGSPFRYNELYVFVYDFQGNHLVNSAGLQPPSPNVIDYRSPDGKLVIQEMIAMTKASGGGAFEYDMINPQTGDTQSKISYFKKIPGFDGFIGCGYYKPE